MTYPSKLMQGESGFGHSNSNTLGNKLEKSKLETVEESRGGQTGEGGEERTGLFRSGNSRKLLLLSKFGIGIGETGGSVSYAWGVDTGVSLHSPFWVKGSGQFG